MRQYEFTVIGASWFEDVFVGEDRGFEFEFSAVPVSRAKEGARSRRTILFRVRVCIPQMMWRSPSWAKLSREEAMNQCFEFAKRTLRGCTSTTNPYISFVIDDTTTHGQRLLKGNFYHQSSIDLDAPFSVPDDASTATVASMKVNFARNKSHRRRH